MDNLGSRRGAFRYRRLCGWILQELIRQVWVDPGLVLSVALLAGLVMFVAAARGLVHWW